MQTTYENFRYHYDKKDNPYTKGAWQNFVEVFFSKIPPSMNDFRSWVFEENIEAGCFTTNVGTDVIHSKENVGIGMGSKPGGTVVPTILQDLDYTAIDCDDLNEKSRAEDDTGNPFPLPAVQEPTFQDGSQDEVADKEEDGGLVLTSSSEGSRFSRTSPSSDHTIHVLTT